MSRWCSTSATRKPSSANSLAAAQPARPAPTTITSNALGDGCRCVSGLPSCATPMFFFSSALSMAISAACGRPIHGATADRTIRAHKHDVATAASRHRQLRVKTVHLYQAASLPQPLLQFRPAPLDLLALHRNRQRPLLTHQHHQTLAPCNAGIDQIALEHDVVLGGKRNHHCLMLRGLRSEEHTSELQS